MWYTGTAPTKVLLDPPMDEEGTEDSTTLVVELRGSLKSPPGVDLTQELLDDRRAEAARVRVAGWLSVPRTGRAVPVRRPESQPSLRRVL